MNRIVISLAALAIGAKPLAAQQHAHQADSSQRQAPQRPPSAHPGMQSHDAMGMAGMGSMMEMMEMMGAMSRVMAYTPPRLLERKRDLRLTQEQEARLAQIQQAARPERDDARTSADQHGRMFQEALNASAPDSSSVVAHFESMHAAMGVMHRAELRAALEARSVLTEAQRRQVDAWQRRQGAGSGEGHDHEEHQAAPARPRRP